MVVSFENDPCAASAFAFAPENWIYFAIQEKICRAKLDGSQRSVIYTIRDQSIGTTPASVLFVDDGGLLYGAVGGAVFRMSLPGSGALPTVGRTPVAPGAPKEEVAQEQAQAQNPADAGHGHLVRMPVAPKEEVPQEQAQNPVDTSHGHLKPKTGSIDSPDSPQGSSQSGTNETDSDQAGQRVASNANEFSTSGRRNINPQDPQGSSDSEEIDTPSTSRTFDSKAAIMAFVREFWSHNASNDPSEWASDFANEAGYCYSNARWADREFIRHDRAKLVDRYPVRHYEFRSPDIEMTGDGNTARVTFLFSYSYSGRRAAAGSGRISLIVQNSGGRWLISNYQEKIDRQ